MVHGVSVIWFPVSDMDRALEFYEQKLGLERVDVHEEWSELEANGLRIGLNARDEESTAGDGGGVLAFQADGDIEEAVEEMRSQGIEFAGGITEHPWGKIASFHDPDGNSLQLYQSPDE